MSSLRKSIEYILSSNAWSPRETLRQHLDVLHEKAPIEGIHSKQLHPLVEYLCTSDAILTDEKVYIVKYSLFPNDRVHISLIIKIIRYLGTFSILNPEKISCPKELQISFCNWIIHIYPLIYGVDDTFDISSSWLHLWCHDFIRPQMTCLIIWSSFPNFRLDDWKFNILKNIKQQNMDDSDLLLYYFKLLKFFDRKSINYNTNLVHELQLLEDSSKVLDETNNIMKYKFNEDFLERLLEFTSSVPNDVSSLYHTFSFELLGIDAPKANNIVIETTKPVNMISLLEIKSIVGLLENWNDIIIPTKNIEFILENENVLLFRSYILSLPSNHWIWNSIYEWLTIQIYRLINDNEQMKLSEQEIVFKHICTLLEFSPNIINKIIPKFIKPLHHIQNGIKYYQTIWKICLSKIDIFKNQHLWDYLKETLLFYIFKGGANGDSNNNKLLFIITTELFHNIQNKLNNNLKSKQELLFYISIFSELKHIIISCIKQSIEDRTLELMIYNLLNFDISNILGNQFYHKQLNVSFFSHSELSKLLTLDSPYIIEGICLYINNFQHYVTIYDVNKDLNNDMENFRVDLFNYLWRNRISSKKSLFKIPTSFIKELVQNIYLPQFDTKSNVIFSILNISTFSFISFKLMKKIENKQKCKKNYSGLLNSTDFKKFLIQIYKKKNNWIPGINNFQDFKGHILSYYSDSKQFPNLCTFIIQNQNNRKIQKISN